ncbi:hypothetical protein JOC77_000160 [Peribacillus deserti]|uniref:Uncharacterized protein n=1 Tax=Peribacillus deserti TaxID=673318 RepID=A0ABS2QC67_9BACI|nr:hypothetical protein [Peribacillus deserti]
MKELLDQWAVQDIVVNLIKHNEILENIITEFSISIMKSGHYFRKLDSVNLSKIPSQLNNAIKHLRYHFIIKIINFIK